VWEDDALESLRVHKWLNVGDLEQALIIARERFPEPPRKGAPAAPVALKAPVLAKASPEPPRPAAPKFHMLFSGNAKFVRPWRVRMRK
jgi:hypothetical protein